MKKYIKRVCYFVFLTIFTQVGGIILLIALFINNNIAFPKKCDEQGFFQYSFLRKLVPQHSAAYQLDETITKKLIQRLSSDSAIRKIFLEPHLKQRWGFTNDPKVRFHGCHAVRHDDHIHIQL